MLKLKSKILLLLLLIIVVITAIDIIRITSYTTYPANANKKIKTHETQIYWELSNGYKNIDWNRLNSTLEFIRNEYDCADFRLVNLIRILYKHEALIPTDYKHKIEKTLFNFRYWLDEPGENSMCYWSENHQILFASAEFLIGQKYPDKIFSNSGLTGKQHQEKARVRILDWLMMRWNYGFTEYYSSVYYKEDIAALINLIDFAEDDEITKKSTIIMDLLFYDIATQSTQNMFISTSGRAYERNRKGENKASFNGLTEYYWGNRKEIPPCLMYGMVTTKKYKIPSVFKEIALDSSKVIIKQSNGLNIDELKNEGFNKRNTKNLMMQWGMEAFVNPKVVRNSLAYIRKYSMFSNEFLRDFKQLDFSILNYLHLEPFVISCINPQYLGSAIQKGNTYTYRTKNFSMYTSQNYHAGSFADQHHVFGMNIKNHFAIYHNHPAVEKNVKKHSPNYWVGYGHLPHSVQDKNVNLSIYNIPKKKGMMEASLLKYTHAYFPKEKFDTVIIDKHYAFAKKEDTYCVFIGANPLYYRNNSKDDLIQNGKQVYWITEASSKTQEGSFNAFMKRIKTNKIKFNKNTLTLNYHANNNSYLLTYNGHFKINEQLVNTHYHRFDSPYLKANHKAATLNISKNKKSLFLDFKNLIRKE